MGFELFGGPRKHFVSARRYSFAGILATVSSLDYSMHRSELSTGRMDPRVGSGRVTILPDFGGSGRVSTSDF